MRSGACRLGGYLKEELNPVCSLVARRIHRVWDGLLRARRGLESRGILSR